MEDYYKYIYKPGIDSPFLPSFIRIAKGNQNYDKILNIVVNELVLYKEDIRIELYIQQSDNHYDYKRFLVVKTADKVEVYHRDSTYEGSDLWTKYTDDQNIGEM